MIEEFGKNRNKRWITLTNGTMIHKTAIVEPWVRFNDNCIVHPYAIIGRKPHANLALVREPKITTSVLMIGKNTIIGCHAIVYSDVVLGEDCFLGDYASVREGSRIGNLCVIGRQVTVNYNVHMGDRNRFQDGTHLTGDTYIGDDCFFGVGVITSNDRRVDLDDYHFPNPPQPCLFGSKILVGSGANILAGVKIGDRVVIGAGALVVKDVESDNIVLGPVAKPRLSDSELIFENLTK